MAQVAVLIRVLALCVFLLWGIATWLIFRYMTGLSLVTWIVGSVAVALVIMFFVPRR